MDVDWQADLDLWLVRFFGALRHKTRALHYWHASI